MKKPAIIIFCLLVSVFFLAVRPPELLVVNLSPSLPRGLYQVSPLPPAVGDYVIVTPEGVATGRRLLKRIAYAGGEAIRIGRDGLAVGGRFYAKSRDTGIEYSGHIPEGECIILGDHPRSYDSRYFGPVMIADCMRMVPLLLVDERP